MLQNPFLPAAVCLRATLCVECPLDQLCLTYRTLCINQHLLIKTLTINFHTLLWMQPLLISQVVSFYLKIRFLEVEVWAMGGRRRQCPSLATGHVHVFLIVARE